MLTALSHHLPALVVISLVVLAHARHHWVRCQLALFEAKSTFWLASTRQSPSHWTDLAQLWPRSHVYWEVWCWDWRRYVIDHDLYDEMEGFVAGMRVGALSVEECHDLLAHILDGQAGSDSASATPPATRQEGEQ